MSRWPTHMADGGPGVALCGWWGRLDDLVTTREAGTVTCPECRRALARRVERALCAHDWVWRAPGWLCARCGARDEHPRLSRGLRPGERR